MANAKRKIKQTLLLLVATLLLGLFCSVYQSHIVSAQSGGSGSGNTPAVSSKKDPALKCVEGEKKCDLVDRYINPMIAFLTAFTGIAVTIGIITGGVRYAAAGDDPKKIAVAKNHISIAILCLLAFLVLYAALQWLVPGGI